MVASRLVRIMVLGIIGSGCMLFAADQFIVKKTKKEPSISTLKQECCQQLVDAVKLVPNLLSHVAVFQQEAIVIVEGYWHSDKESFCECATKEKLASCSAQLKQLHAKTEEIITQYKKVMHELKA